MHILVKASEPGWEKTYSTRDGARVELLRYICDRCLAGGFEEMKPSAGNIYDLLGTSCGLEFWYEER